MVRQMHLIEFNTKHPFEVSYTGTVHNLIVVEVSKTEPVINI